MWKSLLEFYWSLYLQLTWQPSWLVSKRPDQSHFHRRRFTAKYRNKQRLVRSLWFSMGLLMLAFPLLHVVVFVTMLTTFVSFSILDETQ